MLGHLVGISVAAYQKTHRKRERDLDWGECVTINGVPIIQMQRVPQSAAQLHRKIQENGYPSADYKTVRKYLKEMVEQHILEILPGKRYRNVKLYNVSLDKSAKLIYRLEKEIQQLALTNPKILDNFLLPIYYTKSHVVRVHVKNLITRDGRVISSSE
jgi:hypothetical protein